MGGQLYTLLIVALALGMDAFSVSLSLGIFELRLRQIFYIGINIGVFHVVMPLLGILLGKFVLQTLGIIATYFAGLLLIVVGLQMVYSSFTESDKIIVKPVRFGLIIFGIIVSIDSLAVGLSLGIYRVEILITLLCFGIVTMVLTWLGLIIGQHVKGLLGSYSLAFGGVIMLVFGLKLFIV